MNWSPAHHGRRTLGPGPGGLPPVLNLSSAYAALSTTHAARRETADRSTSSPAGETGLRLQRPPPSVDRNRIPLFLVSKGSRQSSQTRDGPIAERCSPKMWGPIGWPKARAFPMHGLCRTDQVAPPSWVSTNWDRRSSTMESLVRIHPTLPRRSRSTMKSEWIDRGSGAVCHRRPPSCEVRSLPTGPPGCSRVHVDPPSRVTNRSGPNAQPSSDVPNSTCQTGSGGAPTVSQERPPSVVRITAITGVVDGWLLEGPKNPPRANPCCRSTNDRSSSRNPESFLEWLPPISAAPVGDGRGAGREPLRS